jgi:predicted ester cyclase
MRRTITPFALLLALLTGVALNETRLVALTPGVTSVDGRSVDATTAVVKRFYMATNSAIATGDTSSLDDIVDPDLADHTARPGVTGDRAGFLEIVRTLHATAPQLRLTALDIVAQDDRVAARVRVDDQGDAAFLGRPIAPSQLWGTLDIFRIVRGRIVEHWDDAAGLVLFEPLVAATMPVAPPTRKIVTLERWSYEPNAVETWATGQGMLVILVEEGGLTIALDARSEGAARVFPHSGKDGTAAAESVAPGAAYAIGPGDAVAVPDGDRFELRNDGLATTTAVAVQAVPPTVQTGAIGGEPATVPPGIARTLLARGLTANVPGGKAVVTIGRATLGTGADLLPHRVGVAELATVEQGALVLSIDEGAAWVAKGPLASMRRADGETVPAGGWALVDAGSTAGYHAVGTAPLTLLMVTFGSGPAIGADGN